MDRKVHVACSFNCIVESEGLLKVTGSYLRCKCGNILETVPDRAVVTTDH